MQGELGLEKFQNNNVSLWVGSVKINTRYFSYFYILLGASMVNEALVKTTMVLLLLVFDF